MSVQQQGSYNTHPRRSGRQRSVVDRLQPVFARNEQSRRSTNARRRARSRTRSSNYYTADDVPQAEGYTQHKDAVNSNLMEVGITRIPLLTEVMRISTNLIDMRWREIHLIDSAIEMMKENKIEVWLINEMQKGVNILKWEMDEKNVREDDIPPLGPETNNFADISVWLIHFYDLLHENMHRIIDLVYSFKMLKKEQLNKLKIYEQRAYEVMNEFKQNVKDFKLEGQAAERYKKVTEEIRKNCDVCK